MTRQILIEQLLKFYEMDEISTLPTKVLQDKFDAIKNELNGGY